MAPRVCLLAALWIAGCGASHAPAAEREDPEAPLRSWVAAEAERLAAAAGGLGETGDEVVADLTGLAAEAEAGRPLLAASRLPSPRLRVEARLYARERRTTVTDMEALEAEAATVAAELDRLEARMAADLPGRPAAVRALADAGWVRARAYGRAAVAYARVTSLEAGLFYLGAARSLLATAAGLAALPIDAQKGTRSRRPSEAALEAELAELDRRGIAAYREPGAEVERHSELIAWNAEVKQARDLLAAGRHDGAALATLEARRRLEEILDDGQGPGAPELRERLAALRERCASAAWDTSLGRLFVETAEGALAAEAPGETAIRRARAVVLHVLPRYFELHEETP